MASPPSRLPSGAVTVAEAVQHHVTLGSLLAARRESERCMALAEPLLGDGLRQALRPGPLDAGIWVMLAAHGQAAAKARHLLPRITECLREAGLAVQEVRVRVSPVTKSLG